MDELDWNAFDDRSRLDIRICWGADPRTQMEGLAVPRVKETSRTLAAFAAAVRSVREMRRLSLEDVARRTSISVTNLRLMEGGFYDPLLNELFELSSALHMSAGEFVRLIERALTEPQQ